MKHIRTGPKYGLKHPKWYTYKLYHEQQKWIKYIEGMSDNKSVNTHIANLYRNMYSEQIRIR